MSRIPLRWMVQEILAAQDCGITFDEFALIEHWFPWFEAPGRNPGFGSALHDKKWRLRIEREQATIAIVMERDAKYYLSSVGYQVRMPLHSEQKCKIDLILQPGQPESKADRYKEEEQKTYSRLEKGSYSGDAEQPIHDELELRIGGFGWWWWILEFLPIAYRFQDNRCRWRTSYR